MLLFDDCKQGQVSVLTTSGIIQGDKAKKLQSRSLKESGKGFIEEIIVYIERFMESF